MKIITVRTPKKFRKANPELPETVEWSESLYRSRLHETGYRVTIASVFIPSENVIVLGASACAPDDVWKFNAREAAGRALGRARQQAFLAIAGIKMRNDTLLGADLAFEVTDSLLALDSGAQESKFRELALYAVDTVAMRAESAAFNTAIQKLAKRFPRHVLSGATEIVEIPFAQFTGNSNLEMFLNSDSNTSVN